MFSNVELKSHLTEKLHAQVNKPYHHPINQRSYLFLIGTLIRRHQVPFEVLPEERVAPDDLPRPPPRIRSEPYITFWDLNLRKDVLIYGHRHRVYECDQFTKDFLACQGVQVEPPEPLPEDRFQEHRTKVIFFFQ